MTHPTAVPDKKRDVTKPIKADYEGELLNGIPHGQGFLRFKYNGEFDEEYKQP